MTTWPLLLVVAAAPIVVAAIERARARAGLSHKELALSQGITQAQWSQQLRGYPGSHIWLDALSTTPPAFRAALLEELRAEWRLDAHTVEDVYRLLTTNLPAVRLRMARAELRHPKQEDVCTG